MTIDLWSSVREWNDAVGVRMPTQPRWPDKPELDLALSLINEEVGELHAAIETRDMVETADAIADSLYVLAGLLLRIGAARTYINSHLLPDATLPLSWSRLSSDILAALNDDTNRLHEGVEARNWNATDAFAHRAMFTLARLAYALGIPLNEVFRVVQDSNMAKLVDGRIIRDESGKIRKPEGWQPPDIAGVLRAHGWSEP